MQRISNLTIAVAVAFPTLFLAACGGGDDESYSVDDELMAGTSDFDESQLPADFPSDLIPPDYEFGTYTELGQFDTATFESRAPVQVAIDHYTDLLGEPTLGADAGEGERLVQWQTQPWSVNITGNDSETLVGITRFPER